MFNNDSAPGGGGGGIYNDGNGTLVISNSIFSGNSSNNSGRGGAIDNSPDTLTISNSTFSGNSAGGGGGIFNYGNNVLGMTGSTFIGNSAAYGGGIDNYYGSISISNSTFSGNSADGGGGGGAVHTYSAPLSVSNSTFSGNSAAPNGGAIYAQGSGAIMANTILAGSSGGNCSGTVADQGGNLSDDSTCSLSPQNVVTDTSLNLGVLGDNGGPTQTIALLPGSVAAAAGIEGSMGINGSVGCRSTLATSPVGGQDQRGATRSTSTCSSGAYEGIQAPPTLSQAFSPNRVVVGQSTTLTFTLANPDASPQIFTGLGFVATLDSGLTPGSASTTCGGTASTVGQTVMLTGGNLAANSACAVSLTVSATTDNIYASTVPAAGAPGALSSDQIGAVGSGSTATLTANPADTATATITATPTDTLVPATNTDTPTGTNTGTPTITVTRTRTPTSTASPTRTATNTRTPSVTRTPTVTRTATPSQTATRIPLVTNGGFESGPAGWATAGVNQGGQATATTAVKHTGTASLQLGLPALTATITKDPTGDNCVYQTIRATGQHTLTFWYQLANPKSATMAGNWQEAYWRAVGTTGCSETGTRLFKVESNASWATKSTVVSGPGQIYFNMHKNGGTRPTAIYIDDVSVQ